MLVLHHSWQVPGADVGAGGVPEGVAGRDPKIDLLKEVDLLVRGNLTPDVRGTDCYHTFTIAPARPSRCWL
jgi:hypothetical protein